jgi:CheY-like chemotaxis protein
LPDPQVASTIQNVGPDKDRSHHVESITRESRILLVDDNHINLKVLSAYMVKLGHEYELASNGRKALDFYMQNSAHIAGILMDISMPIMDGLEATRRIRAHEHKHRITPTPILALTGLASESTQQEALESGVNIFLTKPVRSQALGEALVSLRVLPSPQGI